MFTIAIKDTAPVLRMNVPEVNFKQRSTVPSHLDEKSDTKDVESLAERRPYKELQAGRRKLNSSLCPYAITTSDHSLIT